jgi:hypothetical protein
MPNPNERWAVVAPPEVEPVRVGELGRVVVGGAEPQPDQLAGRMLRPLASMSAAARRFSVLERGVIAEQLLDRDIDGLVRNPSQAPGVRSRFRTALAIA